MRHNHRPFWLWSLHEGFQFWWQTHILEPQFEAVGLGLQATWPWRIDVHGPNIYIGNSLHLHPSKQYRIMLSTWSTQENPAEIRIGDNVLISPGCRFLAAHKITIGDNAMFGSEVAVSDSDWHDVFDRTSIPGRGAEISIGANAWIGERSIILKGVTIGENTIVGAGSVVTRDLPANVIAAGNPVKVIREFDASDVTGKREDLFPTPGSLRDEDRFIYKQVYGTNTFFNYLRTKISPTRKD